MASSYNNIHPVDQILTSLVSEVVPSDDQLGGSEGSRSVAQTDNYLFELRHEAQLRPGAERGRLFRRAQRRRAAQRLSAR